MAGGTPTPGVTFGRAATLGFCLCRAECIASVIGSEIGGEQIMTETRRQKAIVKRVALIILTRILWICSFFAILVGYFKKQVEAVMENPHNI